MYVDSVIYKRFPLRSPIKYYEKPEGVDIFEKWWNVMKATSFVAASASAADLVLYSRPTKYLPALGRIAFISLPIMGIASTFVLVANGAASFRKKDDVFNWGLAGAAVGSLMGVWTRKRIVGLNCAVVFSLLAMIKKDCDIHGYDWFPPPENVSFSFGNATSAHHDWTLTGEGKRGWVKG